MTTTFQFGAELNVQEATDVNVASPNAVRGEGIRVDQLLMSKYWADASFANEVTLIEACRNAVLKVMQETTPQFERSWGGAERYSADIRIKGDLLNLWLLLGEASNVNAAIPYTEDVFTVDSNEPTINPQWFDYFQRNQKDSVEGLTDQWQVGRMSDLPEGSGNWVTTLDAADESLKFWGYKPRPVIEGDWRNWREYAATSGYLSQIQDIKQVLLTEGYIGKWLGTSGIREVWAPAELVYHVDYVPAPAGRVAHRHTYEARINELRGFAEDDEDIEKINEASINDFWAFMEKTGFSRQSGLALLDNGNLRAVWRVNGGHNVGVEFQGDQSALYVIFKRYSDGRPTERLAGIASSDDVVNQLTNLDLLAFVNE